MVETTTTSIEGEAQAVILGMLESIFSEEEFNIAKGRLNRSLGDDGTYIGVSPEGWRHSASTQLYVEVPILVQFYGAYEKVVDRKRVIDSTPVEEYAERFRNGIVGVHDNPHTSKAWYFLVERMSYPPDPLGNLTRWEAQVVARGENTAI